MYRKLLYIIFSVEFFYYYFIIIQRVGAAVARHAHAVAGRGRLAAARHVRPQLAHRARHRLPDGQVALRLLRQD